MRKFKKDIYRSSIRTLALDCNFIITAEEATDRSIGKSKNVLILSDSNSVMLNTYINDVSLDTIYNTLNAQELSLGMTVDRITSYAAFELLTNTEIAEYAHIWDIGYDTLLTEPTADKYQTYLANGGAIFFLGENSSFLPRDNSLINFITVVGGGETISLSSAGLGQITGSVESKFRLENETSTVQFNAPGAFTDIGSGTILSQSANGIHAAVWETGSLSEKPAAAIVSVLDINFLTPGLAQTDFIKNLSIILNRA